MKKSFLLFVFVLFVIFIVPMVMAHCPLCTLGAGAAAGAAVWLGVSKVVVALFIGAFALSMGMWLAKIPKKQYFPMQRTVIMLVIFLTTVLPLLPFFSATGPLYIPFIGEYGLTYALDYSLVSSLFGAGVVFLALPLSKKISALRGGKIVPFQGTLLTLILLIFLGVIVQSFI